MKRITPLLTGALWTLTTTLSAQTAVTVNSATQYQTIKGWG